MKNTHIPQSLLDMPKPWSLTSNTNRNKQLQLLAVESDEIKIALNVLEQC